jgi:orotidine-5'-phosphate decarboxylase
MLDLKGKDRLIVALDVPTAKEAFAMVDKLDNVSFFKVGLQLLMAGDLLGFLSRLQDRRSSTGGVFVDLKLSGDIGNTITKFVEACAELNVKFLTLVESVPLAITLDTLKVAKRARGVAGEPKLLMVPFLSSLDAADLNEGGQQGDVETYIVDRSRKMIEAGCDGLIVSGQAIKRCRQEFPNTVIVSPGIRPASASQDDHKRSTTPGEAIKLGSDYLVVGRPILKDPNPRDAAERIIDEIDAALASTSRHSSSGLGDEQAYSIAASPRH